MEEEALSMIRKYAEERGVSLGRAASDLIHRAAESLPEFKTKNGWVVFDVPAGTPPLTNQQLDEREKEDYDEEYRRAVSARR